MLSKPWKSKAVIFTTLSLLGFVSLPIFTNIKTLAQTSVSSQCTDAKIKKHIQQLNQAETANFNALVKCNSKAVPALITALQNQDENLRIIAIAALGEIGVKAIAAQPFLNDLLKDKSQDIRAITVHTNR
jgi:HEAT repeat protein